MGLLIFDMDGTLVNSSYGICTTVNYVRRNLGLKDLEEKTLLEKLNDPNIISSKYFYETDNFTAEQIKLFEEYYNKHYLDNLYLYKGIKELLEKLSSDFTLSVATNAKSTYAYKMLKYVGVEQYFTSILGYDSVKKPKPNPQMIEDIISINKKQKSESILIGDSLKDIQAAQNANIDYLLVNWGFSKYENGAIDSIDELEKSIYKKIKS